eukprot:10970532-Karenia_brevis.AAC.1
MPSKVWAQILAHLIRWLARMCCRVVGGRARTRVRKSGGSVTSAGAGPPLSGRTWAGAACV